MFPSVNVSGALECADAYPGISHAFIIALTSILLCSCAAYVYIKQVCESSQCMQTDQVNAPVRVLGFALPPSLLLQ